MVEQTPKPAYPYTSFRTILNLLDRFQREGGVPIRIDRGVLVGLSEQSKTQLIAALRFLGLITHVGQAQPEFGTLAMNQEARSQIVAELLKRYYPKQVELAAGNATQQQLDETFEGMDGETRRKAVAFFLHAANYGKIPVSPYFKTPRIKTAIASAGKQRRKRNETAGTNGNGQPPAPAPSSEQANRQKYIELLMKRLEDNGELDAALLDRIEGLLGYRKPE